MKPLQKWPPLCWSGFSYDGARRFSSAAHYAPSSGTFPMSVHQGASSWARRAGARLLSRLLYGTPFPCSSPQPPLSLHVDFAFLGALQVFWWLVRTHGPAQRSLSRFTLAVSASCRPGAFCLWMFPPLVSVVIAFFMMGLLGCRLRCASSALPRAAFGTSDFLVAARSTGCKSTAPLVAPRSAKPAPPFLCAVSFPSALYFDGGKFKHLGLGVMERCLPGEFDARDQDFSMSRNPWRLVPLVTARHRGHVLSTGSSIAGVTQ